MSGAHVRLEQRGLHARKLIKWEVNENGCWICTSHASDKSRGGYPRVSRHKRMVSVGRYMYEQKYGEVQDHLDICHECDNPMCINPEHLFLGTKTDNMQDMMRKGRGNKQKGESIGTARLKNDEVINILKYLEQGMSRKDIANIYGVCKSTIDKIALGVNWSWLKKEVM
jgi:hypothetical protein